MDAAAIQNLTDKILAAEDLIFQATGGKAGNRILTQTEQGFRDALLAQVHAIQKRAKRKYPAADDPNRDKYFIHHSHKLEGNHDLLLTAADAIAKTLPTDALPGSKAKTLTDLKKAADDFRNGLQAQSGGGDTGKAYKALDAAIAEIAGLRRDIQMAADTIWPAGLPANVPICVEFKLPPDRSLK